MLKIVIWSSWGDPFYVGLCGVEVYDAATGAVAIDGSRVSAGSQSSVAALPSMAGDARTIDKLVRFELLNSESAAMVPRSHFIVWSDCASPSS